MPWLWRESQGEDENPLRHQVVELPTIEPIVVEHRLLTCTQCGTETCATLPQDVKVDGASVVMVALLSGMYRNSQRMVQSGMADLFGISMSLGSVNKLRLEAKSRCELCEAKRYVQQQACVGRTKTFTRKYRRLQSRRTSSLAMVCGHTLVTFF